MNTAQKTLLSSIQNYLKNQTNECNFLIADKDKIFIGETPEDGVFYEKSERGWSVNTIKNDIFKEFSLSDAETLNTKMRGLTFKKKSATNEEKIKKFIEEFRYLENKKDDAAENELEGIEWIENPQERWDVVHDVMEGLKHDKRYDITYKNWKVFSIWINLYESNDTSMLDEIKKEKKIDGTTAGKPILAVARFAQYFNLLPKGSYTFCTIPVTYFKSIPVGEWENLLKKFKRYKEGGEDFDKIFQDYLIDEE